MQRGLATCGRIRVIIINARFQCCVCIAAPSTLPLSLPRRFSLAGLPQAVLMCGLAVVERLARARLCAAPFGFVLQMSLVVSFASPPISLSLYLPLLQSLSHCLSLSLFPSDVFWAEKSKFQHAQIVWHFITWNVDAEAVEMIEIE